MPDKIFSVLVMRNLSFKRYFLAAKQLQLKGPTCWRQKRYIK